MSGGAGGRASRGPLRRLFAWLLVARAFLARLGRGGRAPEEPGHEQLELTSPAEPAELETGATRRAENLALAALAVTLLASAAFAVLYVVHPDTQLLGLSIGVALAGLALACIVAGLRIAPRETAVEQREDLGDRDERRRVEELGRRAGEGISRRRLLAGAAGTAGAGLGAALALPAASLGPNVGDRIRATPWRRGLRVVDSKGRPITADDVPEGTLRTGFPEGASHSELGASVVIVRVPVDRLELPPERAGFAPEGVIAFSKICTHAGCAVAMYRHPLHDPTSPQAALVCPCHYSTFDPEKGAEVIFGPAARPLPQLPLELNAARELVASGDFLDQIGPSYDRVRIE